MTVTTLAGMPSGGLFSPPPPPKQITQIWLGPTQLPKPYGDWRQQIIELHPQWNHFLLGDQDAEFILGKTTLEKFHSYSAISDLLRWEYLCDRGGVYLDTDFEIWRSFDDLPPNWMCLYHDAQSGQTYPLPGACGFERNHPFAHWCRDLTWTKVEHGIVDPESLGAIAHQAWHEAPGRFDVAFLPPEYFYPYAGHEFPDNPPKGYREKGTYGAHHWGGSWWSPQRPEPRPDIERGKVVDPNNPHVGGYHPGPASVEPEIWETLHAYFKPTRVFDVGCGEGHALQWWDNAAGCIATYGVDGCKQAVESARSKSPFVSAALCDITSDGVPKEWKHALQDRGTLVWCCEVVEHVEEAYLHELLDFLTVGEHLAMTYAEPNQPGYHHVNCQPADYWIKHVTERGFDLLINLTEECQKKARLHGERVLIFSRSTPL